MTANYPKRIATQTARIRRIAETLPPGQRNTLLNAAGLIDLNARRQERTLPPSGEVDNRTAAQQQEQIAEQYNTAQRILAALIAVRVVSQRDSDEFDTTAFHSRIADVRRILSRQYPQYTLCSRYTDVERTAAGRPFKLFWIESNTAEQ